MKTCILAAVLTVAAAAALAQEFDIFDPNDFIDPRERGAVFDKTGMFAEKPGRTFLLTRAYSGYVSDYQWHNQPTREDVVFGHITSSFYAGENQFNLKFTGYRSGRDARVPDFRITGQYARYYSLEVPPLPGMPAESVRASGRILFTGSLERLPALLGLASSFNPDREGSPSANGAREPRYSRGFGIQTDVYLDSPNFSILGSFVWIRRHLEGEHYIDNLTYYYRGPEFTLMGDRIHFTDAVGIGGEKSDHWHWGSTRLVITASMQIPRFRGAINIAYAPTFVPGDRRRNFYHEVAIYLDRTFVARLGPASPVPR
jgi:hypothetical protein